MRLQMLQDQAGAQEYQSSTNFANRGHGGFNRGRYTNRGRVRGGRNPGGRNNNTAGTILVDRAAPSRSARSATSQIIPHLSAGIDLKKIFSPPPTTRLHHIQQPMVLTLIGMLIVELLTT
jgi:hypothetical protein